MVGTAVYQLALCVMKFSQKSCAENLGGTMTDPPDRRGARKPASRPWTWNSGITRRVRSSGVSLYVSRMFSALHQYRYCFLNNQVFSYSSYV